MENRCILNNCGYESMDHKLFMFPFKNPKKLKEWLQEIPKDLYAIINNSSGICAKHFEKKFILTTSGLKMLHPDAVPSIFTPINTNSKTINDIPCNNVCRFCLKTFQDGERNLTISQKIKTLFLEITQTQLKESEIYSQVICEQCFNASRDLALFRTQLIENQERIENTRSDADELSDIKKEQSNDGFPEEIADVCYEEYLDPVDYVDGHTENQPISSYKSSAGMKSKGRSKLCSDCGKTYSSHAYKRHYERVHLRLKKFQCDYCPYKSYSRNHIDIHLKSHLKIKTHFCEQCGTAFGSGNILRQHYLTHQDTRPFVCNQTDCLLSFKSVYALRRHKKTHSDDRWKFECDECNAKFTDKWHLTRHKNGHKTQPHPCGICGKVFGTKDRMKAHQVYHRQPQFQCELCNKEFYKKPDFNSHLKTHTGQKDYQCIFCPSSYFKNSHLNRHMQQIHKSAELNIVK